VSKLLKAEAGDKDPRKAKEKMKKPNKGMAGEIRGRLQKIAI
jgi:hypothetical protein